MKWSYQSLPMTDSVASQAAERAPPHDFLGSWPYRQYLMGLGHVWLPPRCRGCERAWRAVAPCGSLWKPIGCPYIRVWSHRCLMPGGLRLRCPDTTCWLGWLAGLAGWLGWLAWLAWLAGLAGWLGWLAAAGGLLLAGCCWLMEGSLTRSTLWGGRRIIHRSRPCGYDP